MLGLGAGIDYALLIVGRYREQLAAGDDVPHAARVANATAGTSVIAAGAIVVVAIAGPAGHRHPVRRPDGRRLGDRRRDRRRRRRHRPAGDDGRGREAAAPEEARARRARRRASRAGARGSSPARGSPRSPATLVLLVLATPFTGAAPRPARRRQRRARARRRASAYDKLAEGFGPGFNGPLLLAASLPAAGGAARGARARSARGRRATPDVAAVSPPQLNEAGDAATLTVIPKTSPQDARTSELVERLRDDVLPRRRRGLGRAVYVGGATATFEDLADKIAAACRSSSRSSSASSVLLLMAVFRSLWVPLVSAAFNLLSIVAAYGVVVAVFQWGWGAIAARRRRRGADRLVRPAVHVRRPVRAAHGLQRLPAVPDPRGVPARARAAGERRASAWPAWRGSSSPPGAIMTGGLPRLRHRPGRRRQDDRARPGARRS